MKTLYIISGANGSGKTTFAREFSKINELYFINADEIAKELDSKNITKYKIKPGKMFFNEFSKRLKLDKSFVIETTLSGKYLVGYIEKAKELNYQLSLIYLFLENPQTNINRVKNRVLNGGHHIPKDDIIRRFYRSKNMFWNAYKDLVDDWSIFYNSDETFEEVANNETILDTAKYNEFLKDIDAITNN
ncbi:zeta toxin family protein [Arcobacter sp.]|uniref:zeta toxin family protein n=1 Tax=Arcobacter sp. TaxID=1872629 RepID=UPI003D0A3280